MNTNHKTRIIKNKSQLSKFASEVAKQVILHPPKVGAAVIGLVGNLGAGKTTFTQAVLKHLGVKGRVLSPTFVLIRSYALPITNYKVAYHIDAYRIDKPKELVDLGIKKLFKTAGAIVLVEWADMIKKIMPKSALWIEIKHGKNHTERVIVHK